MEVEDKDYLDTMTRVARLAAWIWNLTLPALAAAPIVTWREMWALLSLISQRVSARWPLRPRHPE